MSTDPKNAARRLRADLATLGTDVTHSQALELVAHALGHRDWNTLAAAPPGRPPLAAIPVIRIFDQAKAYEFYRDFLGFEVVWEHRFEDHAPLYAEIARDGIRLHLSEHYGDGSPGCGVLIEVDDVVGYNRELRERRYTYARPGVQRQPWGIDFTVNDPFHNKITFLQHVDGEPDSSAAGGPIEHTVTVPGDPVHAFDVFTGRIGDWWPGTHTPDNDAYTGLTIAPRVGGPVEILLGERRFSIGTVTEWRPGERYAQTFTLAQDPDYPSTVTVDFLPSHDGTLVRFVHGGWTAGNVAERAKFTDWPQILQRYAAATRSAAGTAG